MSLTHSSPVSRWPEVKGMMPIKEFVLLITLSFLVGLTTLVGWHSRHFDFFLALGEPVALAVLVLWLLRGQRWPGMLLNSLIAVGMCTLGLGAVLAVEGALDSGLFFRFVPFPFWAIWTSLIVLAALLAHRCATSPHGLRKWIGSVAVIGATYLLSAALCFDCRIGRYEGQDSIEGNDTSNRQPALGPAVSPLGRLLCTPQGPSFLWANSYSGSEWIWRVYDPVIRLWFALPNSRYARVQGP